MSKYIKTIKLDTSRCNDLMSELKLTQGKLAEKVGVSESSMGRYINGDNKKEINLRTIMKMAEVLGTTVEYLYGENVPKDKNDEKSKDDFDSTVSEISEDKVRNIFLIHLLVVAFINATKINAHADISLIVTSFFILLHYTLKIVRKKHINEKLYFKLIIPIILICFLNVLFDLTKYMLYLTAAVVMIMIFIYIKEKTENKRITK